MAKRVGIFFRVILSRNIFRKMKEKIGLLNYRVVPTCVVYYGSVLVLSWKIFPSQYILVGLFYRPLEGMLVEVPSTAAWPNG